MNAFYALSLIIAMTTKHAPVDLWFWFKSIFSHALCSGVGAHSCWFRT